MVRLQNVAANVFVHHALVDYVVRVIHATRFPTELGLKDVAGWLSYGASPRATLGIIAAARALALVRGRDYVIPQDVVEVIPDVLRHRLVLSYDALADEVDADAVITRVLQTIGLPQVSAQPLNTVPSAPSRRAAAPEQSADTSPRSSRWASKPATRSRGGYRQQPNPLSKPAAAQGGPAQGNQSHYGG